MTTATSGVQRVGVKELLSATQQKEMLETTVVLRGEPILPFDGFLTSLAREDVSVNVMPNARDTLREWVQRRPGQMLRGSSIGGSRSIVFPQRKHLGLPDDASYQQILESGGKRDFFFPHPEVLLHLAPFFKDRGNCFTAIVPVVYVGGEPDTTVYPTEYLRLISQPGYIAVSAVKEFNLIGPNAHFMFDATGTMFSRAA